jgi:hypothetical protein
VAPTIVPDRGATDEAGTQLPNPAIPLLPAGFSRIRLYLYNPPIPP